ncbi:MAG: hypothetical protein J3R72DRAFT_452642 [Linnemannia gamsii]|nr:MAG: hypothetical protein J3R72DRAFT_452642 [Linnemannia gamsii]
MPLPIERSLISSTSSSRPFHHHPKIRRRISHTFLHPPYTMHCSSEQSYFISKFMLNPLSIKPEATSKYIFKPLRIKPEATSKSMFTPLSAKPEAMTSQIKLHSFLYPSHPFSLSVLPVLRYQPTPIAYVHLKEGLLILIQILLPCAVVTKIIVKDGAFSHFGRVSLWFVVRVIPPSRGVVIPKQPDSMSYTNPLRASPALSAHTSKCPLMHASAYIISLCASIPYMDFLRVFLRHVMQEESDYQN